MFLKTFWTSQQSITSGSNFCPSINQNKVDMLKDPWIQDVEYQFTVIEAGDCIFLPSQYTHQVSLAVTCNLICQFNSPLLSTFLNQLKLTSLAAYDQ